MPDNPDIENLRRKDILVAVIFFVYKLPLLYAPFPYFAFWFELIQDSVKNRIHLRRVCFFVNVTQFISLIYAPILFFVLDYSEGLEMFTFYMSLLTVLFLLTIYF